MADIFDVVADPTRRDLLQLLLERHTAATDEPAGGDLSVGQLVAGTGLSQPTVSKHLKVLRDAGLVTVREKGQHRYYKLEFLPLEALEDWLVPFIRAEIDGEDGAAGAAVAADEISAPTAASSSVAAQSASTLGVPLLARPLALPARQRAVARSIGGAVASSVHGVRGLQRRLRRG